MTVNVPVPTLPVVLILPAVALPVADIAPAVLILPPPILPVTLTVVPVCVVADILPTVAYWYYCKCNW